ncbi:hypothetical protein RJ639_002436 [Escallonia herrerae]|uniref:Uncharacterized protein n=1 Tax=Escallonia herrerae TaxID=1293975 RepID=A0AA89BHC8_9ASTE|nr:hypothetical protein RJ639_002436 [Escallonia herrerae]
MGRSACCEKVGLKKGPWTPEEDQKLLGYIEAYGHGSWRALPAKAGLLRCGKSCRLRWTNYLRPDIKRGKFSLQEEQTIIQLHALLGNRWSAIAAHLPKRTDNEIKNYWNTHLKKRLTKMGIDPVTHKPKSDTLGFGQFKGAANLSHMAQWESARLEAEARLVRESKLVSNPYQTPQLGSSPSAQLHTKTQAAAPKLRCLDVLKAWQGAWLSKQKDIAISNMVFNSNGSLESPTSTLNFSDNTLHNIPTVGFSDISSMSTIAYPNNSNSMIVKADPTGFSDMAAYPNDPAKYIEDSLRLPTFMEGFTDVMLDNAGVHNSPNANGNLDNVVGSCGSDFEENKMDYWNDMLNLVNSTTSGSPVF